MLIFFKMNLFKKYFRISSRLANSLDPDQNVGPDLDLNCLQNSGSALVCKALTLIPRGQWKNDACNFNSESHLVKI